MPTPIFAPGFRLSPFDVLALLAGGAAATASATADRWTGLAVAFVVAHFFLFCNILRMSRLLELTWAAAFALAATLTLVLTIIQVRRPSYHGVAWQRLNPGLPEWWSARVDPNET
jgi:hypothetical protein